MITADQVAKKAGVSTMTVSRVMNGHPSVSDKTRSRVLEVTKELNYRPNLIARSLVTKKTSTIGVLMTGIENPIYSVFISSIIEKAREFGYDVLISGASQMSSATLNLSSLLSKGVDGIILLPLEFRELDSRIQDSPAFLAEINIFETEFTKIIRYCSQLKVPVVSLGFNNIKDVTATVHIDYYRGSRQVVDYLVKNNHCEIGYLHHHIFNQGIWGQRYQGFMDAMREHGLPIRENWMVDTEDSVEVSYHAMERMISTNKTLPTAIVCSNDKIAVGALNALHIHNIKVPDEISIIGHDGSYVSEITYPKLTTVSIQPKEVGASCFEVLLECMQPEAICKDSLVESRLIERGTVLRR